MLVICHCRRILLDAVQWRDTFVSITLIPYLTSLLIFLEMYNRESCTEGRIKRLTAVLQM